ncbi:MAG: creatininase family protein [Mesorhizobium sp.]
MSNIIELGRLTRKDVKELAPKAIVVLPIGSTEQHGEHLPLLTDALIADTICRRALAVVDTPSPVVLAPLMPFGNSHHHLFACAISLSADTYVRVLRDICSTLSRSGFERILFVNGHGGNDQAMRLVSNDVVLDLPLTVAACSYWTLTSVTPDAPQVQGGHAGVYETAVMQHIAPDLVGTPGAHLGDTPAFFDQVLSNGLLVNRHNEWARIGGVTERPDAATEEMGRLIVEDRAQALAAAITSFDAASGKKDN